MTAKPLSAVPVYAIAIAASTGGPVALHQVLGDLAAAAVTLPPVFVTQHISEDFTGLLAAQLSDECNLPCREGVDGEAVQAGHVYLAPGDYHMTVASKGAGHVIKLLQTPPLHFCRPAADPMLASLAVAYGKNTLAVILTGMGTDGCTGCGKIKAAGGTVFVQDAASSAVWGMPGHVVDAGFADRTVSLFSMGRAIARRIAAGQERTR